MKPFVKYPGGKIKEFPIVYRFKPHKILRYFEPFVGGGAVYLNIQISHSYINDKSQDLVNLYKYIKGQDIAFFQYLKELDRLWRLIESSESITSGLFELKNFQKYVEQSIKLKNRKMILLGNSGYNISKKDKEDIILTAKKTALYMCIRDIYNCKGKANEKHTACFYFLREYCYSSMFRFNKDGEFNVPYGGRSYNLKYMTLKIEQMQSNEMVQYFKDTEIYNFDFEEFLKLFDFSATDFIFLDPPYDSEFSTYDNHSFDKKEQIRLANFLMETKAKWMLIIKKTDFIYDLYRNFFIYEYDKNYLVSFKNRNAKETTHLLITNYFVEI